MASITASTSSSSTANHRLYRELNLRSANIYFFDAKDPAPAQITKLQARLLDMEGADASSAGNRYMLFPSVSFETLQFRPGPEKPRFEACLAVALRAQDALNKQRFAAVESNWMKVNETLLQLLVNDDAFQYT